MNNFLKDISIEEIIKTTQKKYILKCASCEKILIEIYTTPEIPGKTKIKCICPYCGDFSFSQEIESKYFINPLKLSITGIENGVIYAVNKQ